MVCLRLEVAAGMLLVLRRALEDDDRLVEGGGRLNGSGRPLLSRRGCGRLVGGRLFGSGRPLHGSSRLGFSLLGYCLLLFAIHQSSQCTCLVVLCSKSGWGFKSECFRCCSTCCGRGRRCRPQGELSRLRLVLLTMGWIRADVGTAVAVGQCQCREPLALRLKLMQFARTVPRCHRCAGALRTAVAQHASLTNMLVNDTAAGRLREPACHQVAEHIPRHDWALSSRLCQVRPCR